MQTSTYTDSFQKHLNYFLEIIDGYPPVDDKVKKSLEELKLSAANKTGMTGLQMGAIHARIENYISGKYGDQVKHQDNRSDYSKKLN